MLLRRRALAVREDHRDDLGLVDAGDDPERAAAALAGVDRGGAVRNRSYKAAVALPDRTKPS